MRKLTDKKIEILMVDIRKLIDKQSTETSKNDKIENAIEEVFVRAMAGDFDQEEIQDDGSPKGVKKRPDCVQKIFENEGHSNDPAFHAQKGRGSYVYQKSSSQRADER